ncbi:hypothetical protein HN51_058307 [Arachis hypogaea]|uniref:Glycoside hydrolase family 5 domain-containing protein n=1 Tax=Arachis hypogaea TaxID=3818 RepID=A0A444X0J0_ARAHY|nr:glycosyl hydrolase 5 family protein isoform X1 [Arachis hypogaea]QHN81551.1 Endoglucanase [Arachis hypogaea]RYQ83191.1 hypothetical protein Ahy_B10g101823 [Arachis hypogaea]
MSLITNNIGIVYTTLFLLSCSSTLQNTKAVPLHTNGRWIVDEEGEQRVKLACLNWVSHLEASVPEGLNKQPLDEISKRIKSLGFNCVRLTWPLQLATNASLSSLSVRQSLNNLGLLDSIAAVQSNNPNFIDLPLIECFQAVVKSLGENDVMVILDNHVTQPSWCCSAMDGNGFFGDTFLDPDLWIMGLTKMATLFNGVTNVVGFSLRNELRGPKQNVNDWYRYMPKGAEAVHAANPDVLVIFSGLNFDTDLSLLQNQSVKLTFNGKLVFEVHRYSFSNGQAWELGNPNQVCGQVTLDFMRNCGFLLDQGMPLFLSEFGVNMRGTSVNDNRYFNCFMGLLAELDLDWALWTLVGSYYLREGVVGASEDYGVLNSDWSQVSNSSFLQRVSSIQQPFQGPTLLEIKPHTVIFHPLTGLCIIRKSTVDPLTLGPCSNSDGWDYTPEDKTLSIKGTNLCLQAERERMAAKLGTCLGSNSSIWEMISDSKMHLSSRVNNNNNGSVCLDVDTNNIIVTNACKCLSQDTQCDPVSQWFKLIDSSRRSTTRLSIDSMLSLSEIDISRNY